MDSRMSSGQMSIPSSFKPIDAFAVTKKAKFPNPNPGSLCVCEFVCVHCVWLHVCRAHGCFVQ